MEVHTQQGMSEERLAKMATMSWGHYDHSIAELIAEVRRLRQREAYLQSAANLWEGLYKELKSEIDHPLGYEHPLPSWLSQEWLNQNPPEDDNGEYARGVRVP